MIQKEVTELKRRLKRETVSFTRMAGCYVDAQKNKVTSWNWNSLWRRKRRVVVSIC